MQGADSLKAWARTALDDAVKRLPPDERSLAEWYATEMAKTEVEELSMLESSLRRIREILDKRPRDDG
ncbi:hypothetical protein [Candidatus Palauibacter sp.]|uniref:hypothetical protein n=1 Tax=Candidatus Palauibacter sp. TaxID=3101350 RepID=UPI003C6EAEA9